MIYTFEDYSLDTDRRECRRAADLIAVEPQIFDILVYLVRNRERVISNDELISAVWNGRIVSDSTLSSRISTARQAVGDSGERQSLIRTVSRRGYRFVGEVQEASGAADKNDMKQADPSGREWPLNAAVAHGNAVTFCRTKDGINLAVASVGDGPVLVRAASWATNIEYDWRNPVTGPLLQRLAGRFRLVRYDNRGTGLSDRDVPAISFQTMLYDLEAVVDALALERFALLGISGGAATSIAYAVRHPHRVSKLVLYGSYGAGRNRRGSVQAALEAKALLAMVRIGWGDDRSIFMRAFNSCWLPNGSPEQMKWFWDLQRVSVSREDGPKLLSAVDDIDIVDLLPKVTVPTIVFHCIHDRVVPFDQGRHLAASIQNAKFVALDSENHALLSDDPAWAHFVSEVEAFLSEGS